MRRIAMLVALVGCDAGEKDLDNGPHCEDTPTVVALDEGTALGFAAQDLLDLAEGAHSETFTWLRDDSTTSLALTVTYSDSEARFVDSEAVYPQGESSAIGIVCDDRVEVDVGLVFSTDDGAFDETWALAIRGAAADAATFYQELDPDTLTGLYDLDDDIGDAPYDERSLWTGGVFDADGARGELRGQINGSEDCESGEICTAWAAEVLVGTWGLEDT